MLIKYNNNLLSICTRKYSDYYSQHIIYLLKDNKKYQIKPLLYVEKKITQEIYIYRRYSYSITYMYYYYNNNLVQISTIGGLFRLSLHKSGKYGNYCKNTDFYNFWNLIDNYYAVK